MHNKIGCEGRRQNGMHCWHVVGNVSLPEQHGEYLPADVATGVKKEMAFRCCFCRALEANQNGVQLDPEAVTFDNPLDKLEGEEACSSEDSTASASTEKCH